MENELDLIAWAIQEYREVTGEVASTTNQIRQVLRDAAIEELTPHLATASWKLSDVSEQHRVYFAERHLEVTLYDDQGRQWSRPFTFVDASLEQVLYVRLIPGKAGSWSESLTAEGIADIIATVILDKNLPAGRVDLVSILSATSQGYDRLLLENNVGQQFRVEVERNGTENKLVIRDLHDELEYIYPAEPTYVARSKPIIVRQIKNRTEEPSEIERK